MSFQAQLSLDLARAEFLDYGEEVSYTASGAAAATVTAIVVREGVEPEDGPDGLTHHVHADVRTFASDTPTPSSADVFAFAKEAGGTAVDWNVVGLPLVPGDGTVRWRCYRREPVERAAEGHRRGTH